MIECYNFLRIDLLSLKLLSGSIHVTDDITNVPDDGRKQKHANQKCQTSKYVLLGSENQKKKSLEESLNLKTELMGLRVAIGEG